MSTFLAGILFGFLLAGSVAVIFITSRRRPARREPVEWVPEFHEPHPHPQVITRIINRHRSIEL